MQATIYMCRFQSPRDLMSKSAAAGLLKLWVRIPPGAWTSVCCECCVLWGRGLCDDLITRPEESYRLWCVVVCDLETSWIRRPWPTEGLSPLKHNKPSTCFGWNMYIGHHLAYYGHIKLFYPLVFVISSMVSSALFWNITQGLEVIQYRRFSTTFHSHL